MPVGGSAKWPETPGPRWARVKGGYGESGGADSPPRPRRPRPAVALSAPALPPPKSFLHRRGGHPAPGSGRREEVLGPLKVGRSPGPKDASSVAATDAMEVVGDKRGELLVGPGGGDGGGVGAGTSSPWDQLEKAGRRVCWGPEVEPAEEGSPLVPLGPGPMEVDDAEQALEDGAAAGEAADKETNSSLAHASPF